MVHLSIGEVYAFSVFKNPLVERFGVGLTPIAIIFSISIVMLGLSAAMFGTWVERAGPRGDVYRCPVLVRWVRHRGTRGGDRAVVASLVGRISRPALLQLYPLASGIDVEPASA